MQIHDEKQIHALANVAGEITDGLFIFARQAKFALDTALYYTENEHGEDVNLYSVQIYQRKNDDDLNRHIFNVSECASFAKFKLNEEYDVIESAYYTTREEMLEHVARFIAEKNHF